MASFNKIILCGYVGGDPEIKSTFNGNMFATLSLATERFGKNANGEKTKNTDWHRVIFWNKKAEIVQQYVQKGSLLLVEGSLQVRDWTDKEGNTRRIYEVIADSLQLMPSSKNPSPISSNPFDEADRKEEQQKKLKEPDAPVAPKNFEADKWAEEPTEDIPF